MQRGSTALLCATGALGGAIAGALGLGSSRWVADWLHRSDPARIIGEALGTEAIWSFAVGAVLGAIAGVFLALVTMHARLWTARLAFAFVLCPAAVLCIDVWGLDRTLPLVPVMVGSLIYATCLACLLPKHARAGEA